MSWSFEKIRRKTDGRIMFDLINDSCDTHNIYDEYGNFVEADSGTYIGNPDGGGWNKYAKYKRVEFDSTEEYDKEFERIKSIHLDGKSSSTITIYIRRYFREEPPRDLTLVFPFEGEFLKIFKGKKVSGNWKTDWKTDVVSNCMYEVSEYLKRIGKLIINDRKMDVVVGYTINLPETSEPKVEYDLDDEPYISEDSFLKTLKSYECRYRGMNGTMNYTQFILIMQCLIKRFKEYKKKELMTSNLTNTFDEIDRRCGVVLSDFLNKYKEKLENEKSFIERIIDRLKK